MTKMSACERCHDPLGEFFGTDGASLCRRCFYAEDTAQRELRADEALIEELPAPLRDFARVAPANAAAGPSVPSPPGTLWRKGVYVLLGSVLLTVGTFYVGSGTEIALGLVGFGFIMTVRGYKLRHYV
jgi:hypothetical protein